MKNGIKKAIILGVAGVTAVNSVPLHLLAESDSSKFEQSIDLSSLGEMVLSVGKCDTILSLSGSSFYDSEKGKLYLNKYTEINLKVLSEDNVNISTNCGTIQNLGDNYYKLSELVGNEVIIHFEDEVGGVDSVNLSSYFDTVLSGFNSYVFVSNSPTLIIQDKEVNGIKANGYSNGTNLTYTIRYGLDKYLSFEDYNFSADINGIPIPDGNYTVNSEDSTIVVDIPITESIYGVAGKEGEYIFNASIGGESIGAVSVTNSVKIDNKSPEISNVKAKYVQGTDGKVYLNVESGKAEISFNVGDEASGVKEVKAYNKDVELETSIDNGVCTVTMPDNGNEVYLEVRVEDNCGNYSTYGVEDLLGVTGSEIVLGIPSVSFNLDVTGGEVYDKWLVGDGINLDLRVANGKGGLSTVNVIINGDEFASYDVNGTLLERILDLDSLADDLGRVDILIKAYDSNNNEFTYKDVYYVDNEAPTLEDVTVANPDKYFVYDGVAYLNSEVGVSGKPVDNQSGLKSIEVLLNGEVVSDSLPFTDGRSGEYSFRLKDNVGNTRVYKLDSLVGKDFNSVFISKEYPTIEVKPFSENSAAVDGVKWYRSLSKLSFTVDSDNLREVVATIKNISSGEEKVVDCSLEDDLYSIPLKDLSDGKYSVVIEAKAKNGNSISSTVMFALDSTNPVVSEAKIKGNFVSSGKYNFFKDDLELKVTVGDTNSGIRSVELLNSSEEVVSENIEGVFTISESGEYFIRVTDNIGNMTNTSVKDLVGLSSNNFIYDNSKPDIEYIIPGGGLGDNANIFGGDVKVPIRVHDSGEIKEFKVSCNGEVVYSSSGKTSDEYILDTSSILPGEDGSYKVDIVCDDVIGNSSSTNYTLYVDKESPVIDNLTLDSEYLDMGNNLCFKSVPSISVIANDNLVNVTKYIIVNKDGTERVVEESSKLMEGDYGVRVADSFGNTSEILTFKDYLGSKGIYVMVDDKAPEISHTRVDGGFGSWFSHDIDYQIGISDNKGIYSTRVTINDTEVYSLKESEVGVTRKSVEVSTEGIKPVGYGTYSIKVEVTDYSGNSSEWSETVYVDKENPYIIGSSLSKEYMSRGYGIFFKSNPVFKIFGADDGVGLVDYILKEENSGTTVSDSKGNFELSGGSYSVTLGDKLGHKVTKSLKDLLGLDSNNIVIDGDKPIIKASRPSGDVDGWFSSDVEYVVNLSDTVGLYSAEVSINGTVVDSFKSDKTGILEKVLKADTSKVVPEKDGSYTIVVKVVDNAGNTDEWSDRIYIDRVSPTINKFVITAEGYKEGKDIKGTGVYGFYLKDSTSVEIHVSDGEISSGVDYVYYSLISDDGSSAPHKDRVKVNSGVAVVQIPKNFKGFISAYAEDRVGNKGTVEKPDGIISEDSNVHVNTSSISMNLPETNFKDKAGYNLYNKDISIDLGISNKTSGIREIEWGIGDVTKGTVSIDNGGNIHGDVATIKSTDRNLVIDLGKILSISDNSNALNIWVKAVDRVGHVSETNRIISIDKDAPIIDVSYGETLESGYYDSNRVAVVRITERNFNPSDVKFSGNLGSIGSWSNSGGNVWEASVVFSEDAEYQWSVDYTDMAGNKAKGYSSEKFVIDKTMPVLNVSFDNNSSLNGNYFKQGRRATVSIVEKNFDENLVKLTGSGTLSGWSHSGDKHTASIVFDSNGEYDFSLAMSDRAGNTSPIYNSGKFIIDKDAPKLSISGVQNGVSYKEGATFKVSFNDSYIDSSKCVATLIGRTSGPVKLEGNFNPTSGEYVFGGLPKELKYDDLYSLDVAIYDKAGNVTKESLKFSINRFGSQYKFLEDLILNNIINKASDITLEETSVDRLDMGSCKVTIIKDGNIISVDSSLLSVEESGGTDGPWVYKYKISKDAFSKDGKYRLQLFSKTLDGIDNSSLVQEYGFLLDTKKPEIIVSGVESGKFYREVSKKVTIDVRDLSGIGFIEAKLNGESVNLQEEDGIYYFIVDESTDSRNIEISVVDKAGNSSSILVEDFFVSSSFFQSLVHSKVFHITAGVLAFLIAGLTLLIYGGRRKSKKDSVKRAEEAARLFEESSSGESSGEN